MKADSKLWWTFVDTGVRLLDRVSVPLGFKFIHGEVQEPAGIDFWIREASGNVERAVVLCETQEKAEAKAHEALDRLESHAHLILEACRSARKTIGGEE